MTTPSSSSEADSPKAVLPSPAAGASKPPAKVKRKGPRRATAPAGAPAAMTPAATGLLVVDADGKLLPPPAADQLETPQPPTSDAEASPAVDSATAPASPKRESEAPGSPAEPEPADPGASSDAVAGSAAAHQSRRERRLAEHHSGAGVDLSPHRPATTPAAAGVAAAPASPVEEATAGPGSAEAAVPQNPHRKHSRFTLFLRGALSLLLICVLVAALGTVLVGQNDAAVGPVDTEVNRQAAWERTTALAATAALLGDTASTPQLTQALSLTAQNLTTQADALDDGMPPSTSEATQEATTSTSAPATPTLAGLLSELTSSGDELLQDAVTAERAMGRVFAAVGTSQLLQAQELSAAAASTGPKSAFLPVRRTFATPQGPPCSSTLEPRSGVTVDAALRTAALGEQKAVYSYQVAAARLAEPQHSKARELLAGHQQKLDLLNAELMVRCLQEALPVAGFDLDSSFTATPATALAQLETELSAIYANLAALSTPAPEPVVPGSASAVPAGPGQPAPTVPASAQATESADVSTMQPANNGLLREMSVLWLLDSAAAQRYWGGTVGALAGF